MEDKIIIEKDLEKVAMQKMKSEIKLKTECMIDSYGEVYENVRKMFKESMMDTPEVNEVIKRTDMFWNIAFQNVKKEYEMQNAIINQPPNSMGGTHNAPVGFPPGFPTNKSGKKSPCQERAERDKKIIDEKIKTIEELKKK